MNEDLLRDLDAAAKGIQKSLTVAAGATKAEKVYGVAYQACVRAGIKPQIKKKYR